MTTRVKQRGDLSCNGINSREPARFPAITVKTCQGQIVEGISPPLGQRQDMIDCKGYVLPLFRGMTILTQILRPAAYVRLALAWYDTTARHVWTS
jgi:hypothetical protein